MTKCNVYKKFDELKKDPLSEVEVLTLFQGPMDFIIAALKPGSILKAHYHSKGSEYYQVLSGEGKIELGTLDSGSVKWETTYDLSAGDAVEVVEGMVHRLSNTGIQELRLIFMAPENHLSNDRFFL